MAYGARDSDQRVLTVWSIRALRAEFDAQPEQRQQETRERVQRLLSAERERRQNVPSYLMTYYKEIYR